MLGLFYALLFLIIGFAIFRKPLMGLYVAVVGELWLANYFLFGNYYLRLRILILPYVLFILFLWYTFSGIKLKLNRVVSYFLSIQVIMVLIVFLANVVHATPIETAAVQLARAGVSVVITIIIYLLIDNSAKLRQYLYIIGFALVVSAIIGILQLLFGGVFYDFKALLVGHSDLAQIDIRGEASGLALFSLMLAYQIVCVLPVFISIFVYSGVKKGERLVISIVSAILAVSLLLTKVRSALIGTAVWMIGAMFFYKKGTTQVLNRKIVLLSTGIALVIFIYLLFPLKEIVSLRDRSAQARLPLNVIGINIALEHPLGIGSIEEFNEFSADNYEIVAHMKGAEAVRYLAPHNQFLNTLLYWGIPGFLMLMLLFFYKFRVLFRLLKCQNDFIWAVAFGILGVSVAYIVTSFFHNAGPFTGDIFYWYVIGLIPALARIANKPYKTIQQDEAVD